MLTAAALLLFMYSGFRLVMAASETKNTKYKTAVLWNLVALTVLVSLWGILGLINSAFTGSPTIDSGKGSVYQVKIK
jgi:hypothetical protein